MPDNTSATAATPAAPATTGSATGPIIAIVFFNLVAYLAVGLPMAMVPGYVHGPLGYGEVVAGFAVSIQYLATLLSRAYAGRLCDNHGPKRSVLSGMALCCASGVCLWIAGLSGLAPVGSLASLIVGRLLLGTGESLVTTGTITWGIARAGSAHTGKVISWNGMTSYGGMAIGAPLGVVLAERWGFGALGLTTVAMTLASWFLAWRKPAVAPSSGERLPFSQVFRRMVPFGLCLALGSVGFGAISTFVTLFFASRHWPDAALALTLLGVFFIAARLLFAGSINRFGGFPVALVSLVVEASGLLLLWLAAAPWQAFAGAALTGFGFALVFPSLGMEAVRRVPSGNRGAALGAYALFLDLALGVTGPLTGVVANRLGYASVFLLAALAVALAAILSSLLHSMAGKGTAAPAA
ncbi:major facilitator superfamily transporter [Pseudogulbenkiania sp. NH8B]|uniref:MFS transporter n=1 Tax=Pseudogulbenkiania sp. (strain NH8B) TaxID=748280 RepID=UPI00022799B5|nr:MFS transporter [Pseudogulbenkiania sp. NH8B]BAK77344.1 major facilitator superfamily transporter [Pseudogulbenkiania sp. NH8B]